MNLHIFHRYQTIEEFSSNVCWYGVCKVCGKRKFERVGLGPGDRQWIETGVRWVDSHGPPINPKTVERERFATEVMSTVPAVRAEFV